MVNIFISYRRADSHAITDRIQDRLSATFGQDEVFQDVEDLPPGVNYQEYVEDKISIGDVLLVIMGHQWSTITDDDGNRRIDKPDDPVRLEIEAGMRNPTLTLIPVLVEGATMPPPEDLPESLRELHYRNALQVRHNPDFERDIQNLIESIRQLVPGTATSNPAPAIQGRNWTIPIAALVVIGVVAVVAASQLGIFAAAVAPTATATATRTATVTATVITDTPPPTEDREATVNARVAARLTQSAADNTATAEAVALLATDTHTPLPTFTATATETATPTDLPTDTPVPTATVRFPDGRPIEMIYDNNSFYIVNPATSAIRISTISFQAINENGRALSYRYDGTDFARIYPTLDPGKCGSLEIVNAASRLRPPECDGGYNFTSAPARTSLDVFWIARDEVTQFRVLANGIEAGRCEIAAGRCEVLVP